ncbi:MAG TPA: hypothetical protein VMZ52_20145 [Bryobacteraceae bacterium]|nr:hypothetical protein [Bryobacteraceae bacterium]
MKHPITLSLFAILWTSCLLGQAHTDAEERFKMKTGRLHPNAERRLEERKQAECNQIANAGERRNRASQRSGSTEINEGGDAGACPCSCRNSTDRVMRNSS